MASHKAISKVRGRGGFQPSPPLIGLSSLWDAYPDSDNADDDESIPPMGGHSWCEVVEGKSQVPKVFFDRPPPTKEPGTLDKLLQPFRYHSCTLCRSTFDCDEPDRAQLDSGGYQICQCLHEPGVDIDGKRKLLFWCSTYCMQQDLNGTTTDEDTEIDCLGFLTQ